MIQAMVWALVLTSGAGMSRSGPMSGLISVAKRRVSRSSSRMRELLGIDDDPALAAAVGDVHDRALPGHPHRQGPHLVEGHVLVVADAALGRSAGEVVLDPVAGEDLDVPVVHGHREVDGQLALGHAEDVAETGVEVELVGGLVELLLGDGPDVRGFGDGLLFGHGGRMLSLAIRYG